MKKKSVKKLKLNRDTILRLEIQDQSLAKAAGGWSGEIMIPACMTDTKRQCPP